ncbi:MAG: hypothetical protein M3308_03870 [Actinomycetota bacterium]|nr:hypothetical protein [Actinomycetota bacterium]
MKLLLWLGLLWWWECGVLVVELLGLRAAVKDAEESVEGCVGRAVEVAVAAGFAAVVVGSGAG